ncbi:PREDICTED: probable methyltransferase-like protein 15 isoform X3 [Cercocebus atys]|uniref:probable methyltransferase-like protein 15 isoform X3 n=1 Tax=Cercocebus atys TaxID=9531 RepID=UPI0005F5627A|nr:PREDICTED: probable methyltransferase-like protein 15 isoform X3 [Cercocebus atys]
MLRYPYFCRMYKECLSCWLASGIPNLGVWPKRIHTTAEKYGEYEAQEQTDQTQAQELHRSQDRDFETMAKLHIPVMVDEVVHCLSPQKGQIFLDMTFGSGGHTKAILQKESDIVLYALDRDPTAYALAEHLSELYPKQIRAVLGQFSQAEALLMKAGVQPGTFDGVLMDLGCSSMQLDTPERGFSLRKDGPLDMRMDGGRYPDMPTAADVVNALDQPALASILRTYGEEKHAKKIASAIVQARSIYPITRTQQLASIVAGQTCCIKLISSRVSTLSTKVETARLLTQPPKTYSIPCTVFYWLQANQNPNPDSRGKDLMNAWTLKGVVHYGTSLNTGCYKFSFFHFSSQEKSSSFL